MRTSEHATTACQPLTKTTNQTRKLNETKRNKTPRNEVTLLWAKIFNFIFLSHYYLTFLSFILFLQQLLTVFCFPFIYFSFFRSKCCHNTSSKRRNSVNFVSTLFRSHNVLDDVVVIRRPTLFLFIIMNWNNTESWPNFISWASFVKIWSQIH